MGLEFLGFYLAFWVAVGGDPEWAPSLVEPWRIDSEDLGLRGPFKSWEECQDSRRGYDSEYFALVRRQLGDTRSLSLGGEGN